MEHHRIFIICYILLAMTCQATAYEYKVLGIGAPCMDILISAEENFIDSLGEKGGSKLVEWSFVDKVLNQYSSHAVIATGGSCANTIKGLASLGHRCAIYGKLGNDEMGKRFFNKMTSLGILPLVDISVQSATQVCLCFISPDGDRTMRCHAGASIELSSLDLSPQLFQNVSLVHIEGYSLYTQDPEFVPVAMQMAKQQGALISFDLSSFELVKKYKEKILHLLKNYVDIVFANGDEVKTLTGLPPEEGCEFLKNICPIAVVMVGKNGCFVGSDSGILHSEAFEAQVLDTTGAGDLFASGFLHGILEHLPLEECSHCGNKIGAAVIEVYGAEIPSAKWNKIKEDSIQKKENVKL
jgi:sugar/nucleoside kinase (ribokinase family)